MSFRFLHAADLHLDTPFEGVGKAAPHVARALRDASLDALDALVTCALDQKVDFLVLAGDLYDGPERGLRAQLRLRKSVGRLADANIHTFIVHGNHDPVQTGWTAIQDWPDAVHVFSAAEVETVPITARDGTEVQVHGISYDRRNVEENLVHRFPRVGGNALHVGVLHANVGGDPDHQPYSPCSLDDLRATGHHYWALGHIHQRQVLAERPHVVYPGNLQGRSFKHSELGAKGAMVVQVDGRQIRTHFEPLDRIRFARVDIDVSGLSDVGVVQDALEKAAEEERAENGGRGLLLNARLHGRSDLAKDLIHEDAVEELLAELRSKATDAEGLWWWAGLDVQVTPPLDLERLREGDDLAATLAQLADEWRADDALDDLLASLLERRDLDHLPDEARPRLVDEALTDALTRLRS